MQKRKSGISHMPTPQPHPWLFYSHGKHRDTQTFFSISEDCHYVKQIPMFSNGKSVCTCSHGWLVMIDNFSTDCFLLNLASMKKIQLPPLKFSEYELCVLSLPPTNPNCTIIFCNGGHMFGCKPGDNEWIEQNFEDNNEIDNDNLVTLNEKIYGFVDRKLVMIEYADILSVREIGVAEIPYCGEFNKRYLVESCGELFAIFMYYSTENAFLLWKLEVFKMDFSKMVWDKVKSLGDRAFFLGPFDNISCSATKSGIKGNCIYFTLGGDDDNRLYVFDMDDNSLTVTLPCKNVVNNVEAKWIMPIV